MQIKTHLRRLSLYLLISIVGAFVTVTVVSAARLYSPSISPTKTDAIIGDDGDGKADPGETIEYTVVIPNVGAGVTDATGVTFTDDIDDKTTLVAGSLTVSPVAGDDTFPVTVVGNVSIDSASLSTPFSVTANDLLGLNPVATITTYDSTTAQGGQVVMTTAGPNIGQFTYDPPAGFEGADTFTYTLADNPNAGSAATNRTATVSITVSGMIWFIDNNAAACTVAGCGRLSNPFSTLGAFNTLNNGTGNHPADNDNIFIYESGTAYTGGVTLRQGQKLVGQDATISLATITGLTPPSGSTSLPAMNTGGNAATIQNGSGDGVSAPNVSNVKIRGLSITGNVNAIDITTSTTSGDFEIADNTILSAGQEGIDINGGGGTLTISLHDNTVTATGNGIDIQRTAGSVTITAFDDNVVTGTTGGAGINIVGTGATVLIDANAGTAGHQQVLGGNTVIGQSGNGVGTSGLVLSNVRGDLSFSDLDIYADGGTALFINSTTPNFNAGTSTGLRLVAITNTPTLAAVGGAALDVTDANINLALNSLTSSITTATRGVSLLRVSGTLSAPLGSINSTNAGGTGFFVDGDLNSGANISATFGGTITADIGRLIQILDVTPTAAASYTFSGAITDNNDGDGNETGVSLTGNTNTTFTFRGGLAIRTTSNAAFNATGGGTVNVCDENPCNPAATGALVNTLTSTTGTALNVANTTIGANNLEFRSISSNGGTGNGIILDTTGSSGGLKVVGDGTNTSVGGNSSGGTIANKSGADGDNSQGIGIYLNNTSNVVLRRITINGINQNFGIRGFAVNNFTLEYSTVGSTTPAVFGSVAANLQGTATGGIGEGAIYFGNQTDGVLGLTGTGTFTNNNISAGRSDNMQISNGGGALNRLNITGSTFGFNANGNAALTVVARRASSGNTVLNSTVTGNTFTGSPGNAANFTGQEPTTSLGISMDTIFQNNNITNTHPNNNIGGSNLTIAGFSNTTFNVSNNSFRDAHGSAITLQLGAPVGGSTVATSLNGTVNNNTIGVSGVAGSGSVSGNGIFFSFADNTTAPKGQVTLAITNNQIHRYNGNAAIYADNTGGNYNVDLTVTGNVADTPGAGAFAGLAMAAGAPASSDDIDVCAQIGGAGALRNDFSTGDPANANDIILGVSGSASSMRLPGYSGTTLTDVQNFVFGNNNFAGTVVSAYSDIGLSGFTGGAACASPIAMLPDNQTMANAQPPNNDSVSQVSQPSTTVNDAATVSADSNFMEIFAAASASVDRLKQVSWTKSQESASTASTSSGEGKPLFHAVQPAPLQSGETVTVPAFTLPAGKSVTIKFRVTVNGPFLPLGTTQISNQGTITADGGISLLTDDPDAVGATNPTITLVDRPDTSVSSLDRASGNPTNNIAVTWQIVFDQPVAGLTASNFSLAQGGSVSGATFSGVTETSGPPSTTWNITANNISGDGTLGLNMVNDNGLSHDATNLTFTGQDYTIDNTPPTVTNVAASTAGCLGASPEYCNAPDVISVQVTFSEVVTITGTPTLTLETGATNYDATYVSGSGTNTLTFTYTVQAGDNSSDLDYTGTAALALNGGIIEDGATNPATLTLPALGAAGSLGANEAIIVDTSVPTTTSFTRSNPATNPTNADTLVFHATFSEDVTGVDTADFDDNGTSTATVTLVSPVSASVYDVTVSGGDLATSTFNGQVGLDFSAGMIITDRAGNPLANVEPAPAINDQEYTVDNTGPTVTNVTSTSADATYTAGALIPVTVTFTEAVTVTGTPQLTLETGTTDRVINFAGGSGTNTLTFDYTVQAGDSSPDLDYVAITPLALNGGTIRDATTNNAALTLPAPGTAGSLGSNKAIVIDAVAPTVTNVSSTSGNSTYGTGAVIPVTVTFSEAVTVTGTPQLTLETGAIDWVVNYTGGSGTNTLTFTYTAQLGDTSPDLDYTGTTALALNGGTIRDAATNNATLTLASPGAAGSLGSNKDIVINATEPIVTNVSSTSGNGTYGIGVIIPVTVTFSEPVTVTGIPQLTLETGATDRVANYSGGSGNATLTFDYTVQAGDTSADLDYLDTTALALNSGTIQGLSLNNAILTLPSVGAAGSLGANKAIVIDTTTPAAPVLSTPADASITSDNTPTVSGTAEANSTVTVYFDGSSAGTTTASGTGNWTFIPGSSLSDGAHAVKATATDAAGNTSADSNTNTFTVDTTPPAAPVLSTPADASITSDNTPTVSGTAEANSTVTVFLDGVAAGTTTANGAGNWTFTPPSPLSDGSHTARTRSTDAIGNTSVDSNTNTFTVDTIPPNTIIDTSPTDPSNSTSASFTFSGTGVASFECKLDSAPLFGACAIPQPQNYSGLGEGNHTFQVRAVDAAGNTDLTPASFLWVVDTAAPSVVVSSLVASPTNTSPIPVTVTFSESVTGFIPSVASGDLVITNGTSSNPGGTGTTYTFDLIPSGQGPVTVQVPAGSGQDAATNGNTVSNLFSITYDTVSPTVTIDQAAGQADPTNLSPVNFAVQFTEPVTDFAAGDVTLSGTAGATTVNVSGGPANYNVAVSGMTTGGTVVITIASGIAHDAASNGNTASINTDNTVAFTFNTTTGLISNINPAIVGQNVTFTATVTSLGGIPTGNVEFLDGATSLGTVALAGGQATLSTSALAQGSHNITAHYLGTTEYNASTSPIVVQDVGLADTTTTVATSGSPSGFGTSVTFTATVAVVAPGAGTPTGDVEFFDGVTSLGTRTLGAGGQAALSTASLTTGSHTITATYGGDADFNGSTTVPGITQVIDGPPGVDHIDSVNATSDAQIVGNEHINVAITQLLVVFNKAMNTADVENETNYGLVQDGSTVIPVNLATYDNGSLTATLNINGGGALPNGRYTLTVSGNIHDTLGAQIGTDFVRTFFMDTVAPNVAINQAAGQADPTSASPINFTVVFSEAVSGFDNADVNLGGTAGATTAVVTETAPMDGTTYNVTVSGMTLSGTVIASIPAGGAQDAAANGNAASTSTDNTVTSIPLAITSANNITFVVGNAGTFTVTTAGTPLPAINSTGILPSGVTFTDNADGTATLAGTPAPSSAGAYNLDFTASNAVAPDATQAFTLTIEGAPGVARINSLADTGDAQLAEKEHTSASITQLLVVFNKDMDAADAQSLSNYSLVQGGSTAIVINGVVYDNLTRTAALSLNGGAVLANGKYTFTVKGTIKDAVAAPIGTDFIRTFFVDKGAPHHTSVVTLPSHNLISNGSTVNIRFSSIEVIFDEDVSDPAGDTNPDDVTNPQNYLLLSPGPNGNYDTLSCAAGIAADDIKVPTGPVTYTNNGGNGPFVATVGLNNGLALENGSYKLFLCGTTSIVDLAGNALNDNQDQQLVFDVLFIGQVRRNPQTGFAPNVVTVLPEQPAEKAYSDLGSLWIEIPALKLKTSITGVPLEKDNWDVTWLNQQVGWLEGTAYPTWEGNTVLTAHAYTADGNAGPFASLKDLKYGETVVIHLGGMKYTYAIDANFTINPNNTYWLTKHEKLDWITLITCEQYDEKTKSYRYRRVVRAVLVSVEKE